ncbi:hypothetical protein DAI22_03g230400 [Oryza sativa Japonica Group]|nr:hypothetical protein DAI22_03g230400 [Oryza sativa Japonica Group]
MKIVQSDAQDRRGPSPLPQHVLRIHISSAPPRVSPRSPPLLLSLSHNHRHHHPLCPARTPLPSSLSHTHRHRRRRSVVDSHLQIDATSAPSRRKNAVASAHRSPTTPPRAAVDLRRKNNVAPPHRAPPTIFRVN